MYCDCQKIFKQRMIIYIMFLSLVACATRKSQQLTSYSDLENQIKESTSQISKDDAPIILPLPNSETLKNLPPMVTPEELIASVQDTKNSPSPTPQNQSPSQIFTLLGAGIAATGILTIGILYLKKRQIKLKNSLQIKTTPKRASVNTPSTPPKKPISSTHTLNTSGHSSHRFLIARLGQRPQTNNSHNQIFRIVAEGRQKGEPLKPRNGKWYLGGKEPIIQEQIDQAFVGLGALLKPENYIESDPNTIFKQLDQFLDRLYNKLNRGLNVDIVEELKHSGIFKQNVIDQIPFNDILKKKTLTELYSLAQYMDALDELQKIPLDTIKKQIQNHSILKISGTELAAVQKAQDHREMMASLQKIYGSIIIHYAKLLDRGLPPQKLPASEQLNEIKKRVFDDNNYDFTEFCKFWSIQLSQPDNAVAQIYKIGEYAKKGLYPGDENLHKIVSCSLAMIETEAIEKGNSFILLKALDHIQKMWENGVPSLSPKEAGAEVISGAIDATREIAQQQVQAAREAASEIRHTIQKANSTQLKNLGQTIQNKPEELENLVPQKP